MSLSVYTLSSDLFDPVRSHYARVLTSGEEYNEFDSDSLKRGRTLTFIDKREVQLSYKRCILHRRSTPKYNR